MQVDPQVTPYAGWTNKISLHYLCGACHLILSPLIYIEVQSWRERRFDKCHISIIFHIKKVLMDIKTISHLVQTQLG